MKPCIAMLPLLLAACVAGPRDIPGHVTYLQDGSAAYAVTCDGPFSDGSECRTRAGQICAETGYVVVSQTNEALSFARSMVIRCKTPSGLYPPDERKPPL